MGEYNVDLARLNTDINRWVEDGRGGWDQGLTNEALVAIAERIEELTKTLRALGAGLGDELAWSRRDNKEQHLHEGEVLEGALLSIAKELQGTGHNG